MGPIRFGHHRHRRHGRVGALVMVALVAALGGYAQPPAARAVTSPFTDIAGTTFEADIDWLFAEGVTKGCSATLYCPDDLVTRGQMASFLARMFDLPSTTTDFFTDDDGTTHEAEINRLAAAGITQGCTTTTFCPLAPVLRGQMASFLVRAIPLTAGAGNDYFRDDDGTTYEADIDRAAAAGIANGCGPWLDCPRGPVRRGEMAGFLHRVVEPVASPPHPAPPTAVLHVATTGDDGGNDCRTEASPCRSIAHAVDLAFYGDTVSIGPGSFAEKGIVLGVDLTILGSPGAVTTIDATGGARARLFTIEPGRVVRLSHLALTGGRADFGGAIDNSGLLTIDDAKISGNRSGNFGGAIHSQGTISKWATYSSLSISGSTVDGNSAATRGGGISVVDSVVTITNSSISHNTASQGGAMEVNSASVRIAHSRIVGNAATGKATDAGSGGGISVYLSSLIVSDSTIADNMARSTLSYGGRGGGIWSAGGTAVISRSTVAGNGSDDRGGGISLDSAYGSGTSLTLVDSTVNGNAAGDRGGGLAATEAPVDIVNSTITGNTAGAVGGGGIYTYAAELTLANALVLGNTSPGQRDVSGSITTKLASIVGIPAGMTLGGILDPDGLQGNGGPTQTIALTDSAANPARHHGDAVTCAAALVGGVDQRGRPRTPPCDIGAYELQP